MTLIMSDLNGIFNALELIKLACECLPTKAEAKQLTPVISELSGQISLRTGKRKYIRQELAFELAFFEDACLLIGNR